MWRTAGDVVLGLHYAFMAYLLVGGFVAWRWRWTIVPHLLAVAWAVLIVTVHLECPLTALQNWLRARAGQPRLSGGFIDVYLRGTVYPANASTAAQLVLAVVVLSAWTGFVLRAHRRVPA